MKWLTCKFPLQHPYIIQQAGSENTWTQYVEVVIMIYHKILETNVQGNKKQLEGRIDNQVLGVKQLKITTRLPTADKQNQP